MRLETEERLKALEVKSYKYGITVLLQSHILFCHVIGCNEETEQRRNKKSNNSFQTK